jgi:hypothetical protein
MQQVKHVLQNPTTTTNIKIGYAACAEQEKNTVMSLDCCCASVTSQSSSAQAR